MPAGSSLIRLLGLGFAFAISAAFARADNWERFRGPNGAGVSDDKNIPVKFSAKDALWKVAVPGIGHSSPVVWGKLLFLQSSSMDGNRRWLLCYDTADGKEFWKRSIPAAKAHVYPIRSSWASSTPTTDGEAVFISFWDGKDIIIASYSVKGEPLWSRNLGQFTSQHGPATSPIVYKDKVFFPNDMDREDLKTKVPVANPARLYAFNKKTGATVWELPREGYRASYAVPWVLEKPGAASELIVSSTTAITSYDPDSGKPNWNWKFSFAKDPLRVIASTIYHDGLLITSSGDGSGERLAVAVAMNGSGKESRPDKLWDNRKPKEFPYVTSMLTRGDHLYFVNDAGMAGCYHAKTGKKIWYEKLPSDPLFNASPILINGKVYACSEQGDVFVFPAEPTYQEPIKNAIGESIRATPAVANGRMYIRGKDHLFCFGSK